MNSTVENSPNASIVVARSRMSLISGTENAVLSTPRPGALWLDVDQPLLAAIDERAHQHAADDAEDRGVGADAERERDHDGGGEALRAQQRAQTDAHVLHERLRHVVPAAVPDAAHLVAHLRQVAELPQRVGARLLRRLAAIDALLDLDRQVAADFVVEFALVGTHGLLARRDS